MRVEEGSVNLPIADFAAVSGEADGVDTNAAATAWVDAFNKALAAGDYLGVSKLFLSESYWRDHLALSWAFRTLKGPKQIADFLSDGCRLKRIAIDRSSDYRSPQVNGFDGDGRIKGVQTFVTVENDVGNGLGLARLVKHEGKWKAFTFFTSMREIKGHEEATFSKRPQGVDHGGNPGRRNWQERRMAQQNFEDSEPVVLIVGAGQGGLTSAARLKMLGVESLIVDREERVGDNWRTRYHQLVLHDPVWYDHMPYINFPPHWPIFTPKDKLAEFFESYVKLMELNVWTTTTIVDSSYDEHKRQWTVKLLRKQPGKPDEERIVHPRHIIMATGHSGEKNFPSHIKGIKDFQGDFLGHSSEFKGARMDGKGRKAVVVGCCNSGHDISQDFYEKGYDITMVQRSSTCVISSKAILKIGLGGLYDENGPPVDDADVFFHSIPTPVLKGLHVAVTKAQNQHDREILEGLAKAGFKIDQGPDDAGLFMKYFQRGGGYYIDVGASQLIVDGKIKIKQGQEIAEVTAHGLKFADGSEIEADEIVFATGYQNMRTQARSIFGDALADQVNSVWGFDKQGEIRTLWQKTGHPGFWFFGGNLALCRYFSRLMALQIKALEEGVAKYEDR